MFEIIITKQMQYHNNFIIFTKKSNSLINFFPREIESLPREVFESIKYNSYENMYTQ